MKHSYFRINSKKSHGTVRRPAVVFLVLVLLALYLLSHHTLFFRHTVYLPFQPHFSAYRVYLSCGKQYQLKVRGLYINRKISYTSSHSMVASVTQTGLVRAWKKGSTIITATLYGLKTEKIKCIIFVS